MWRRAGLQRVIIEKPKFACAVFVEYEKDAMSGAPTGCSWCLLVSLYVSLSPPPHPEGWGCAGAALTCQPYLLCLSLRIRAVLRRA